MMMVTRRWTLSVVALAMLGVVTLGAVKLAAANAERADCPGRVVCPITGKLVCKDRCPVGDAATKNADTKAKPACCRKG